VRFEPLALELDRVDQPGVCRSCGAQTDTGVKTLDDVKTREGAVGGSRAGTDGRHLSDTLINLLGTKFKVVSGYRSGAEMTLAASARRSTAAARGAGRASATTA